MRDSAYTPGSTSSGSKAPLFIVLGLVLLLGAGGLAAGAWWLLFRDKGESTASALPSPAVIAVTPTPAATTPPPVAPGIPAATVGQPTPAPAPAAPEQPEQPEQRPGSAVPTASADPAPVAPPPGEAVPEGTRPPNAPPAPSGPLESADFVVGVRESEGALYVRAGRDVGLVAGQTLSVLGAEVEPGKRPRIGTATIAEVLEFKSRVTLDGAATAAAGERVVAIPQGGSAPADLGATPTPPPTVTGEPPPRPAPPPTTASPLPPTTIGGPASQRGSAAAPPRPQATPPSVRPSAPPPPPRRSGVVPPPPPPPRRAVTPAPPPPPRR